MDRSSNVRLGLAALAAVACIAVAAQATAQVPGAIALKPTPADQSVAKRAVLAHRRAVPPHTLTTETGPRRQLSAAQAAAASHAYSNDGEGGVAPKYPADLYYLGGPTVPAAQSHAIYLLPSTLCTVAQCWGDPEGFLRDLGRSEFIHVVDQYTGVTGDHRYGVGQDYAAVLPAPSANFSTAPLTDSDLLAYVYLAAKTGGQVGYGHIYHVFLPQGTDECFDATFSVCYSPDNLTAFKFCAYHGSVDFSDIGHVLYTVEPFQQTPGCQVAAGTPNGQLADSTNDVLSHETFETITDPDGTAWFEVLGAALAGSEIGDECVFLAYDGTNSSLPTLWSAGRHTYATQPEYDNQRHGCTVAP